MKTTFSHLFSLYRKQSSFASIEEISDAMADLGVVLDSSTFSHWLRGTRVPRNRVIVLAVLRVLFLHQGITTKDQANLLLEAANHRPLSSREETQLFQPPALHDLFIETIRAENTRPPLKPQKTINPKLFNSTFNLVISAKMNAYLDKIATKKGLSKANFIRSLIEQEMTNS